MLKLEFMKYAPTARNTDDSLSSTLSLSNTIVMFTYKNRSSTMIATQSRNVLICLFVRVDVRLSVFTTKGF